MVVNVGLWFGSQGSSGWAWVVVLVFVWMVELGAGVRGLLVVVGGGGYGMIEE